MEVRFGEEAVRVAGKPGSNPKLAAYYPLIFFCGKRAFSQIFELTGVQSEGVLNLFDKTS